METADIQLFVIVFILAGVLSSRPLERDPLQLNVTFTGKEATVANQNKNNRIDYIEFPATDIAATKTFYSAAFGWKFTDYGPDYVSFEDGRTSGGFTKVKSAGGNGVLIVLYASDLKKTESAVVKHGGTMTKPPFEFPGGRRFHFTDPNGNELAVWSEK